MTVFAARLAQRIGRLSRVMGAADLEAPVEVPADPSKDEVGQLTRRFQDMSDTLREQFAQVRRAQEGRRTLVANLSHDLRTPLASIIGYAETLQHRGYADGTDLDRYATIIAQRARYMDRMLDHLFEASLLDRPDYVLEKRSCNIGLLVEQVVVEFVPAMEEGEVRLDFQVPSQPVWAEVNDWSLKQVVRNLIENALTYGGEGGYLGVQVSETPEEVRITVSDRGQGIPPEEQERIFEPFYRVGKARRGGNIGVGLALAREVVARHGGRIWVESEPFVATEFTIALPRNPQ